MVSMESLECSLSPELQAQGSQGQGWEQWGFGCGGFWDCRGQGWALAMQGPQGRVAQTKPQSRQGVASFLLEWVQRLLVLLSRLWGMLRTPTRARPLGLRRPQTAYQRVWDAHPWCSVCWHHTGPPFRHLHGPLFLLGSHLNSTEPGVEASYLKVGTVSPMRVRWVPWPRVRVPGARWAPTPSCELRLPPSHLLRPSICLGCSQCRVRAPSDLVFLSLSSPERWKGCGFRVKSTWVQIPALPLPAG